MAAQDDAPLWYRDPTGEAVVRNLMPARRRASRRAGQNSVAAEVLGALAKSAGQREEPDGWERS